jgi:uncharacterized membrane-anchored protein
MTSGATYLDTVLAVNLEDKMDHQNSQLVAKVPQITFLFWIIKILATTLGETGGDAVTMSWLGETTSRAEPAGYLIGTGLFGVIFIVAVLVQIRAKKFHPFIYWLTIVATTTVATTLADFCDRSLGIGYTGGSMRLATTSQAFRASFCFGLHSS